MYVEKITSIVVHPSSIYKCHGLPNGHNRTFMAQRIFSVESW